MVQNQRNLCRFTYLDSAIFSPSKIKLAWIKLISRSMFSGIPESYSAIISIASFGLNGSCNFFISCCKCRFVNFHIGWSQTWFLQNSKNSNFGKIFWPSFWALKTGPKRKILIVFTHVFLKTLKEIPNFKVGYLSEKMKILKNAWNIFEPFFEKMRGRKISKFRFPGQFLTLKNMVKIF